MRTTVCYLVLMGCLCMVPVHSHAAQTPDSDEMPHVSVTPEVVKINAFYRGTDVTVHAGLPADCDGAAVKIQGKTEEVTLKRKGKVYIFWLNVDNVMVSGAPDIYIINASGPMERICSPDIQRQLLLGYNALKESIDFRGEKALAGSEFSDFIKLKENNGSYRTTETAQLMPVADSLKNDFNAVLHIPPAMPSGNHQIRLYYFKNGMLMGESRASLEVEKVGVPKYLYSLAFEHPAFYGLFACAIAMITGIIMGLIFGKRKRGKQ